MKAWSYLALVVEGFLVVSVKKIEMQYDNILSAVKETILRGTGRAMLCRNWCAVRSQDIGDFCTNCGKVDSRVNITYWDIGGSNKP